ncbi:hypothetical protein CkaCkLH20_05272 [Colletotrichum karsti]|uniref:DUF7708 domain-containing protein n=1 Tax=Colletotrichum karsti TaxID=1095194 RepID=A0A9P6LL97_9PEZI|nr:uncharacterized protein CkaCkLH20_05272 [Colletotrichum karsti]KAF9877006.1 hypothetical protein CkaCkLH20_05272 [Colletotrichum karsti]
MNKNGQNTEEIDIRKCTWGQVQSEIWRTAESWKNRPDKQTNTMKFVNKVGSYSEAVEGWLGLLPAGDYGARQETKCFIVPQLSIWKAYVLTTCSICGVFKLVIGAAGQYSKVEEEIFKALSEIPDFMRRTKRYVDVFWNQRDHRFEQLSIELFRAMLQSLRHIMQFFADSKIRKVWESFGKQNAYKMELLGSLRDLQKCADKIQSEGALCHAELSKEGLLINRDTQLVVNDLRRMLESHLSFQRREMEDLRKAVFGVEPSIDAYDMVNVDHNVSEATTDDADSRKSFLAQVESIQQHNESSRQRLLDVLQYDREAIARDVETCLQLGYRLDDKAKSRAASLVQAELFKAFLQDAHESTRLLVNGREDVSSADGISPLSFVAAELSQLSVKAGAAFAAVFVLNYFCAEHPSSPIFPSPETSVTGLMASLIGQLVWQMNDKKIMPDLSFLTEKKWGKISRLDPAALFTLFKRLFRQLPREAMLLCIIDEISIYETQMLQEDTYTALQKLVQLSSDQKSPSAAFKLLVLSRNRALVVGEHFSEHTLDLQEDIETDGAANWTIQMMMA